MTTIPYADLMRQAEEAGFSSSVIPDGEADLIISKANVRQTQGNPPKDQIGMLMKVIGGPHADKVNWVNQVITVDNPDAMRIFFTEMGKFGLDRDFFSQPGLTTEAIATALEGRKFHATVGHRVWGKAKDRVDNTFTAVTLLSDLPPAAATPAVIAAPAPAPAPAPAAVPVPVAAAPANGSTPPATPPSF